MSGDTAEQRVLRRLDRARWQAQYLTALDGCCAACAAGQPVLDRYTGAFGTPCHVHARPAWQPRPAVPFARSALL